MVFHAEAEAQTRGLRAVVRSLLWPKHRLQGEENGRALGSDMQELGNHLRGLKNIRITIKIEVKGLPWWTSGKDSRSQCKGPGFNPWSGN